MAAWAAGVTPAPDWPTVASGVPSELGRGEEAAPGTAPGSLSRGRPDRRGEGARSQDAPQGVTQLPSFLPGAPPPRSPTPSSATGQGYACTMWPGDTRPPRLCSSGRRALGTGNGVQQPCFCGCRLSPSPPQSPGPGRPAPGAEALQTEKPFETRVPANLAPSVTSPGGGPHTREALWERLGGSVPQGSLLGVACGT